MNRTTFVEYCTVSFRKASRSPGTQPLGNSETPDVPPIVPQELESEKCCPPVVMPSDRNTWNVEYEGGWLLHHLVNTGRHENLWSNMTCYEHHSWSIGSWSGIFMPTCFVLGCARSQAFCCSHFNRCREQCTYCNSGTREHTLYKHLSTPSVTCQTDDLVPFTKAAWTCVYMQYLVNSNSHI